MSRVFADSISLHGLTLKIARNIIWPVNAPLQKSIDDKLYIISSEIFAIASTSSDSDTEIVVLCKAYLGEERFMWLATKLLVPTFVGTVACIKLYHKLANPIVAAATSTQNDTTNLYLILIINATTTSAGQNFLAKINLNAVDFRHVSCSPDAPCKTSINNIWSKADCVMISPYSKVI